MSFQSDRHLYVDLLSNSDSVYSGKDPNQFDTIQTTISGLSEFFRNIDSATVRCTKENSLWLQKCGYNSGRIFPCREFPKTIENAPEHTKVTVNVGKNGVVLIAFPKGFKYSLGDLLTNFCTIYVK